MSYIGTVIGLLIASTTMLAGIRGECANTRQAASFAVLVDTSGSMVGYYQRRDPRPPLAIELVESLVTETMAQGDRLVIMSFDSGINDSPDRIVAQSPLDTKTALPQFERLGIEVRPGRGTLRTAAIGRAVKALDTLARGVGPSSGGIIYVVTDRDDDCAPSGREREFYDSAKRLQGAGKLRCLSRIPQGGMILEIWQWRGSPGAPEPPSPAQTIDRVKRLLRSIIPQRPVTSGPIAADFEHGRLVISPAAKTWQVVPGASAFELPIKITSEYRALHFKGSVESGMSVVPLERKGRTTGTASLTLGSDGIRLSPGESVGAALRVTGIERPGVLTLKSVRYRISGSPKGHGAATTEPALFVAADPVTTARVSGAIWLSPCEPRVAFDVHSIPALPVQSPPRILQGILVAVFLAAMAGAARAMMPKPVPLLTVMYWVEGAATHSIASLHTRDAGWSLVGVNARMRRDGVNLAIVVTPGPGSTLLTTGKEDQPELRFGEAGRFIVKGPDGRLSGVNFDFGRIPPKPELTDGDFAFDETPPIAGTGTAGTTEASDDWNSAI